MLAADYYDGRSARRHRVMLMATGTEVFIQGEEGFERRESLSDVQVSERLGSAPRILRFADGAHLEVRDHGVFEQWLVQAGHRERRVDLLQRSWLAAGVSLIGLALFAVAAYWWGLPWVSVRVAENLPPVVVERMTDQFFTLLDGRLLKPTELPEERQQALRERFNALAADTPGEFRPQIEFRTSSLGANAFALPDGRMVLLDDLVKLAKDDEEILAVLSHELGHVSHRHNLKMLVRATAVGTFFAWWVGDFSAMVAAAPAAIANAHYSRQLETEADDFAATLLKAHGIAPARLADMLEKLQAQSRQEKKDKDAEQAAKQDAAPEKPAEPAPKTDAPSDKYHFDDYLSSHPATAERIRRLRSL